MADRARGFTLLELLVVLAIIGFATLGVSLSLPDANPIERDAQRLAGLLESARAGARARSAAIEWRATAQGFEFSGPDGGRIDGGDDALAARAWLSPALRARVERPAGATTLVLGPEPLIPAQTVLLMLDGRQLRVATDGFSPFAVQAAAGQ